MQRASRQTIVRTTTLPNGQKHEEEVDLLTDFSWRNFFSTINFAKIMQKLSKHRSHRIRMLVQYKSSVSAFRGLSGCLSGESGYIPRCRMANRRRRCAGFAFQAVLKRILKVQHPMLQLHVLKLIKSQVPFCGRKWRQCKIHVDP